MPQLDPASFPSQLFWLAITFVALYLVMWRVALPRIAELLQERQERIDDDLERAEKLKSDAEAVLEAYEKTIAEGRSKAQDVLREAALHMAAQAEERHAVVSAQIASRTAEAEARIAAAREEALGHIRAVAAETAQAATARLIGAEVSDADAARAVSAALEERR